MAGIVPVGSDGIVPGYDPEGLWKTWAIWEIYMGQAGAGKFVPKVKDYVRDPDTYETWIVDHLDPGSFIPTLRQIRPAVVEDAITANDEIFGVGPGPQLQTWRALLNTRVFPHTMNLDNRFMPKGTMCSYAKVFLGYDTTPETGKVISKVYDASGQFVSDAVPLELAAIDSHTNYTAKTVMRFNVTEKWPNGQPVTCVIYADDGHVVVRQSFLIEITDTIMDVTTPQKYIADITLKSVWLSSSQANLLEYPLNIPLDGLNMVGVVVYSDGSTLELPVDGTKFAMYGLTDWVPSVPDESTPLVLRYSLSGNEKALAGTGVNNSMITKPYTIKTINPNNSIAVKLFGYPVWVSDAVGYMVRWFLLNLERNIYYEVTDFVKWSERTGPYDPKLFGILQRKEVYLNLRDVSGAFIPFVHPQMVDFWLISPPNVGPTPCWKVATKSNDQYPMFGEKVYGLKKNNLVNFGAGCAGQAEWLDQYYWRSLPMVNPQEEVKAPTPTHFIVTLGGTSTEWSIADWNSDLSVATSPTAGSTAIIRFIRRMAAGDLQLSYAAALIKAA